MMKKTLSRVIAALFGSNPFPVDRGVAFTQDASASSFPFRMGAGFPGDITRTHPVDVFPELIDSADSTPPTAYGQAVLLAATNKGVRPFVAGDTAVVDVYGVTVRPFPAQQTTGGMSATFGSAVPPTSGEIDILRRGTIIVQVPLLDIASVVKGGAVFVRCQNSPGANDPVAGFKGQADGGNTAALNSFRYQFNGTPDASGFVELMVKI